MARRTAKTVGWSAAGLLATAALVAWQAAATPVRAAGALESFQQPAPSMTAQACARLSGLTLADTTISRAEPVAAGPLSIGGRGGRGGAPAVPAFCRVAGTIRPTADSNIAFEVWMPMTTWNHRFEAVGNGGLAGSIGYPAMADAVRAGYATAGTDTGHTGATMTGDWALGHPEKITDFGYRAVHEMTVQAKAVMAAFYGSNPRYAYWNGCSEGGGQALSEAQRYPADYDGILAGAPANYLVHLQAGGNWIGQAIHRDPASFIPASKLPAISKAVLAACDAADGVTDGVLEDPRTCHFDPGTLLCQGTDGPTCLTAPQIAGLKKVYDGAKNPRTGATVFPGHMRGGEQGWGSWIVGTNVPPRNLQHDISVAFFSNFVFDDPHWDWTTFDFDRDVTAADRELGAVVNQIDPDLSAFRAHGGKLLQYHGWSDPAISPLNSVNYFTSVQQTMGDTQDFYRLFMFPGMEHCGGGPGPNQFDRMRLITDWVEQGAAPDAIIAARPGRTRPVCAYPRVAKYSGAGSTDDAANFACAMP